MMNKKAVTVLLGAGGICLTLFRTQAQNKNLEREVINSNTVFTEIAKQSLAFKANLTQEHHHLNAELMPRDFSSSTDQTLLDWVVSSTNDHQVLDFSPENLTLHIAFLRLIGISTVSLNDLGRQSVFFKDRLTFERCGAKASHFKRGYVVLYFRV